MQAEIENATDGTIVIGPDNFRQVPTACKNEVIHTGAEGNYLLGDHSLTFGLEHDRNSIFNLFAPFSNGDASYDSIEDFEAQRPSGLFYQNAISNDANDAAASFDIGVTTAYVQNEMNITPKLVARYGVRAESYQSTGEIKYNQNFVDRHGFSNTSDLDGKQLLLPRIGLSYQ